MQLLTSLHSDLKPNPPPACSSDTQTTYDSTLVSGSALTITTNVSNEPTYELAGSSAQLVLFFTGITIPLHAFERHHIYSEVPPFSIETISTAAMTMVASPREAQSSPAAPKTSPSKSAKSQIWIHRTPSTHGPFCFDIAVKDITRDLSKLAKRLKHQNQVGALSFPHFDPADGIVTIERLQQWVDARRVQEIRECWNSIQAATIEDADTKSPAHPEYSIAGETDQAYDFRCRYMRNRNNDFELDPWKAAGAPKVRWHRDADILANGRQEWDFEKGFAKEFRADDKWRHIDFDDTADLAPEEVRVDGVTRLAETWCESHPEVPKRTVPKRSDTGYQSNGSGAGDEVGMTSEIPAPGTGEASLGEVYVRDIAEYDKQHPLHLRRRVSHALEVVKRRVEVLALRRKVVRPRAWTSL